MMSLIQGHAMMNRPHGLLFLSLKFSMYIIKLVRTTDLLTLSENHQALFQLLQFIYKQLKDEMLDMKQD